MEFTKEHLINKNYDWSTEPKHNVISSSPDRRLFDRLNGNQILYLINFFGHSVGNITIDDGVVLKKRIHTSDKVSVVRNPRVFIYPKSEARKYFGSFLTAARGTKYYWLTGATLAARYVFEYWLLRVDRSS